MPNPAPRASSIRMRTKDAQMEMLKSALIICGSVARKARSASPSLQNSAFDIIENCVSITLGDDCSKQDRE